MERTRLGCYAEARDTLLTRIVDALEADERVIAAWLSGSFGRGEGDEWADYDLHVVIDDAALPLFLADRDVLYARLGEVVLLQDEIPNAPAISDRFHLVNFASPYGPIEVDWSFIPASEARKPAGHRTLFQRRLMPSVEMPGLTSDKRRAALRKWAVFFWAMAPIAVKFAGRGDTRRAAGQIGLLSRALISLWRLLEESVPPEPWQPDFNRPLEPHLDVRLPKLGTTITPAGALAVIEQHCNLVESLQGSLGHVGAAVGPRIIEQTRELIRTAAAEIEASRFRPLKFR